MKYLRLIMFSALLFITSFLVCSNRTQATSSPLHIDLTLSLGFIVAQQLSLEIITDNYPSLSPRVEFAHYKFNTSFGAAETNMRMALKDIHGDNCREVMSTIERSVRTKLRDMESNQISREMAVSYLDVIEARAEGAIVSPIFETLLHYRFMDNPAKEFVRGFREPYRTAGHPKSKGLDFQLEVPQSWNSKEGQRPNIIQFFGSNNGRGPVYASMMVRDFVEEVGMDLTDEEIGPFMLREESEELAAEMFSDRNLRVMVRDMGLINVRNIETKRIILDRWPGASVSFLGDGRHLDMVLTVYNHMYLVIYKNYLIFLHFHIAKLPGVADIEMDRTISDHLPLFRLLANSLVIQSQY